MMMSGEMEGEPGVAEQPGVAGLVGRGVVQHDVDIEVLTDTVASMALRNGLASGGCSQGCFGAFACG